MIKERKLFQKDILSFHRIVSNVRNSLSNQAVLSGFTTTPFSVFTHFNNTRSEYNTNSSATQAWSMVMQCSCNNYHQSTPTSLGVFVINGNISFSTMFIFHDMSQNIHNIPFTSICPRQAQKIADDLRKYKAASLCR